tara:strand:+ start:1924 stop:2559 length:636 start_codon:yes stop_codon:yes gene_type:complete
MDGNNRFSKKRDISIFDGYKKGAEKLLSITKHVFENYDSETISAFGLSHNNTKRSKILLSTLFEVFEYFLDQNHNNLNLNFNILFKGDLSFFPIKIKEKIKKLEKNISGYKKNLVVYLNYSGQLDIIKAAKFYNLNSINIKAFEKLLLTNNFKNPDMLIRTGGYQRISDFFLYQISFTELFFLKKLWPEITNSDISKIFESYKKIERKFGY